MKKSVLVEIIRSFSRKEIREVQKWLLSPAHNQRKDVVQLFSYLTEILPDGDENLEKEHAWKAIMPKEPFDDAKIRQTMYFLLQSIEDYLAYTEMTKSPVQVQLALARSYRQRKIERPFKFAIENILKEQQKSPIRNSYFLNDVFQTEQERYYFLMSQDRSRPVNLQETSDALDVAFLSDKLRLACHILAHKSVFQKANYDTGLLPDILQFVEQKNLVSIPAIAVYYYGYKAFTEKESEEYFTKLENLIIEQSSLFLETEMRELYMLALNYCIRKINAGFSEYLKRAFILYKNGFEKGFLIENNVVSRFSFNNAVAIALKVKDYRWTEVFIQDYQKYVEDKHRESIVYYNLSRLHFEKGDYDKAMKLLTRFEHDDMLSNFSAKTMLAKIYYETGDFDPMESLLEAMRTYLQRKEAISPNHKLIFKNTISLMKKLLHLNPYSKAQVEKFRELIMNTNPLTEREWLLKQIDRRK